MSKHNTENPNGEGFEYTGLVRLTGHGMHRRGDGQFVVAREEAEQRGVDLVRIQRNAMKSTVVRLQTRKGVTRARYRVHGR